MKLNKPRASVMRFVDFNPFNHSVVWPTAPTSANPPVATPKHRLDVVAKGVHLNRVMVHPECHRFRGIQWILLQQLLDYRKIQAF